MGMQLIETIEVGSGGAASIEFTSIPQDGVDLVMVTSLRNDATGAVAWIQLNSAGDGNYDWIRLRGTGSAADSSSSSAVRSALLTPNSSDTADTFSNGQIYISNYTSSANKSYSVDTVEEGNNTAQSQILLAGIYNSSSTVTSIELITNSGNFVQYSTASLYKITAD